MDEVLVFVLIGFFAQLVDGALGMAYGLISSSALIAVGVPPAQASAIVHTAEVFTTGISGISHWWHENIRWKLVLRLAIPGVAGAVLGAWVLSNIDASVAKSFVSMYLLALAALILYRAWRNSEADEYENHHVVAPTGFAGGLLDAMGGGGWGPITTTTLMGSGHPPRYVIGSGNFTEFFVTTAAATTFFVELGQFPIYELVALVGGGVVAAPFGGWVAKHVPHRWLMVFVGCTVTLLCLYQFSRMFWR